MGYITVITFGELRKATGKKEISLHVTSALSLEELFNRLNKKYDNKFTMVVNNDEHWTILVNGNRIRKFVTELQVKEGSVVAIMPLITAG